ncbi:iron(III) transport system ATP-binding protein [Alteribacillus persepolensis]|uniref:Iron(III) transport system ATP-binding protein n=1 Tax=Alteribacillus persepolensis TaxID=568899 RepID=A0A1G8GJN1_9BACI|nr:ABC transporter ATP-binding protein [Alteribacillus persepolensis]SDH94531.1 iron(III) transport system ATP-binding protein [Alteribacillus persepolensis]
MNIQLSGVTKEFGKTAALSSVDANVKDGEFIAILGPSGCGKTTLLRLLAGFESPTEGYIEMDDKQVAAPYGVIPPEKRNIGMVFQSFALWPHLTVQEQIRFPLLHHKFVPSSIKKRKEARTQEVLELVNLTNMAERMPHELSGGQKQRVALARAVAAQPSLLLMDEPLSSLDAELRMEMRHEIQRIHRHTQTTVIYVTHDQSEALAMADRIIVMKDGAVEQIGSPETIYRFPQTEFVASFVGKANLVPGFWKKGVFHPNGNDMVAWEKREVAPYFMKRGVMPVRPEEFCLKKAGNGLTGRVENVQFQGRDVQYTILVGKDCWTVYHPAPGEFRIGEQVVVELAKEQSALRTHTEGHDNIISSTSSI